MSTELEGGGDLLVEVGLAEDCEVITAESEDWTVGWAEVDGGESVVDGCVVVGGGFVETSVEVGAAEGLDVVARSVEVAAAAAADEGAAEVGSVDAALSEADASCRLSIRP